MLTENGGLTAVHPGDPGLEILIEFGFLAQSKLPVQHHADGAGGPTGARAVQSNAPTNPNRNLDPADHLLKQDERRLFADQPSALIPFDDDAVDAKFLGGQSDGQRGGLHEDQHAEFLERGKQRLEPVRITAAQDDPFQALRCGLPAKVEDFLRDAGQANRESDIRLGKCSQLPPNGLGIAMLQRQTTREPRPIGGKRNRSAREPRRVQTNNVQLG